MPEVFADTSGWASFFVETELHHAETSTLMARWRQQNWRVITTNYVLSEFIPLMKIRFRVPREKALDYTKIIRAVAWIEIVHIDKALDAEAWRLLETRTDKEWSLVDAASFVVMKNRGITEALTTDHHFEQAGFTRLLV